MICHIKGRTLRAFLNRMLRRIFGPKREEAKGLQKTA